MKEYCKKCGCEIHTLFTGKKYIDHVIHCRDCYYSLLGEIIEEHPIGLPISKTIE